MNRKDNETSPELLVLLIQNLKGDPFERLMNRCMPVTKSLTNKYYLGSYEKDDLLQEAHQILIKAADEFDIRDNLPFLQFYHMMLTNHLNRLLRAELAHKRRANANPASLDELVEAGGVHIQGVAPSVSNPEDVTIVKEMFANYFIELSPFEEDVFLLFLKGYTTEEIAKKLEYKKIQVKNAVYRCSVKLKRALS